MKCIYYPWIECNKDDPPVLDECWECPEAFVLFDNKTIALAILFLILGAVLGWFAV